jgi:16S rRNA (uracil1498-N3)-methyltransferase
VKPRRRCEIGHHYSVNVILLEERDRIGPHRFSLADARAGHLLDVLHAAPGHVVRVGLVDGPLGTATVDATGNGRVTMTCAFDETTPIRPTVDVLLALPRPKVMRRLWAQLSALGVGRIVLTNAERVERHYFDTHVLTEACSRPLLIEGLQQARDTRVPTVSIHRQFKVLVEDHLDAMVGDTLRLVADPSGVMSLREAIAHVRDRRVLIAIGPEGGWNAFELALLEAHGFQRTGLGPRTLRLDTACVAVLALVHDQLETQTQF